MSYCDEINAECDFNGVCDECLKVTNKNHTYNEDVMRALRQMKNLEPEDTSLDSEIMQMEKREIFNHYCQWNGLLGCWSDCLLDAIENIFNVELSN